MKAYKLTYIGIYVCIYIIHTYVYIHIYIYMSCCGSNVRAKASTWSGNSQ